MVDPCMAPAETSYCVVREGKIVAEYRASESHESTVRRAAAMAKKWGADLVSVLPFGPGPMVAHRLAALGLNVEATP